MKNLFLILIVFIASLSWSQPLATPEELGMDQQYFIRAGLSFGPYLDAYDGTTEFQINPDEVEARLTTAKVPQIDPQFVYRFSIGSHLNLHHFGLDFGYAPIEKGYYELAIDYQYHLFDKKWRPTFNIGLDFMQVDVGEAATRGNNTYSASYLGKGFHLGVGYHYQTRHFGWQNRAVIRGLSIDNVFIGEDRFRISGLTMSWQPSIESSLVLFY